jgi:hypothetical protein
VVVVVVMVVVVAVLVRERERRVKHRPTQRRLGGFGPLSRQAENPGLLSSNPGLLSRISCARHRFALAFPALRQQGLATAAHATRSAPTVARKRTVPASSNPLSASPSLRPNPRAFAARVSLRLPLLRDASTRAKRHRMPPKRPSNSCSSSLQGTKNPHPRTIPLRPAIEHRDRYWHIYPLA